MEAKFKVGDRVQTSTTGAYKGTVKSVYIACVVDWDDGDNSITNQDFLGYAKLSEEDAWIEVALMVGRETYYPFDSSYDPSKEVRHKAYQILGGNGVKVTEEVKQRVRSLIERAKRV